MTTNLVTPGSIQSVPEALAFWAAQTPDAIALLSPGRESATYRELHAAASRLASELRARGLTRQEAIALLLPEGPELCVLLLATIAAGIAVPLAWPNPEAAYAGILANPRVRAVIVSDETAAALSAYPRHGLPVLTATLGPSGKIGDLRLDGDAWGHAVEPTQPDADDIALILHSSGTTGRPKLVPRTHRNLVATAQAHVDARGFSPADRCLSLSRATYAQGIIILMTSVYSGSSLISVPELNLRALPLWLRDCRPTYLLTTPAVLRAIATGANVVRDALRAASLRYILSSAGPLSADEVEQLETVLQAPILNTYGMSEASFIAGEPFPTFHRVPGAVGLAQCQIRTVDEQGTPLGRHETGEIVVRGPRVFPGYLDDPDANAAAFLPDGWFRTGDIGFVDDIGYLHLTGRLGETINRGGEKIVPDEVDAALRSHPAVADAAVFAVPDALLGEDLVAAVVLRVGMTVERKAVHGWLLDRLPLFKLPRRIWTVEELPRTATGKVQRGELTRRWQEEHG
jgi:acyl-CoA synthetase (AMP-forming)/AMP-acid ligase II